MEIKIHVSDIHLHLHVKPDHEVLARFDALRSQLGLTKDTIMAAIDDLKTSVAGLISEATTDITTLITNAANNSNDPAIAQLAIDVKTATQNLHDQFTAATGTPVPPAPSA